MIAPEIKKILQEVKQFKRYIFIVAVAGILMSVAQGSIAVQMKNLISYLTDINKQNFWEFPLTILGLYFISGICRYFHLYLMNYTAELVVQSLRQKLQRKFMSLNLSFHNTYASGSGGLISRILNDIQVIQNGLRMVADFFREPILLIFLISWLFILNWKLTCTIIFVLPVILGFLKYISKTIKVHSLKGQEDLEKITSTIKESLDGVRTIQSFNLETEMANRFQREAGEYLFSRRKLHQKVELSGPVTELIAAALMLGILMFMGYEISQGRASSGDFISYLTSLLMLSAPIKKLQESYVRIQETIVATKRVFSLLDEAKEVPQIANPVEFPKDWNAIEYKNVSFAYGNDLILKNVNLKIPRGSIVAFVGASGSGKSTLVNLLERFFDPSSGEILIGGVRTTDLDIKELRKNVALVSQDVFLFSDTIERNIRAGDFSRTDSIESAAKSANAHDFISRFPKGYQNAVGERGGMLSGGEKQRISIARAIYKDSSVLILDEATSALDSVNEKEVQKGLDQLVQGRTTFVIAHRLSTVAKADCIYVLKNGEIIEQGTHQQLLDIGGEYRHLYDLQH